MTQVITVVGKEEFVKVVREITEGNSPYSVAHGGEDPVGMVCFIQGMKGHMVRIDFMNPKLSYMVPMTEADKINIIKALV